MVAASRDGGELTKAQIGGVVGGALGFVIILGAIAWLLMRRLNEIVRFVKARLEPEKGNINGKDVPEVQRGGSPVACILQEEPAEVWDPHSQGMRPNMRRELIGSYEAHGISEMEERGRISEMEGKERTGKE